MTQTEMMKHLNNGARIIIQTADGDEISLYYSEDKYRIVVDEGDYEIPKEEAENILALYIEHH